MGVVMCDDEFRSAALVGGRGLRVPEMRLDQTDQLTSGALHVESNGDPPGRLIMCVYGFIVHCRSFDRFVPASRHDHFLG